MGRGDRDCCRRRDALRLSAAGVGAALAGCFGGGGSDDGDDGEDSEDGEGGDGPREVVVGTAAAFPPFEDAAGGSITGFDVDLFEAILETADGYAPGAWRDEQFTALPDALANGEVDVLAAAVSITDPRAESVAFVGPYFRTRQAVLVHEDDPTPGSLEALEGSAVGAQTGTTAETLIETRLIDAGVIDSGDYASWDTYPAAVDGLAQNVVDAVVVDTPAAWAFAETDPVDVAFGVDSEEQYGFAVRSDDEDLATALEDGLLTVRETGRYNEIATEWLSGEGQTTDGTGTGNRTDGGNESGS